MHGQQNTKILKRYINQICKENRVSPISILNKLKELKLLFTPSRFLRLFNTTAVTVTQKESSFSSRFRIKDVLKSTVAQN
jgi:hypothetical protein